MMNGNQNIFQLLSEFKFTIVNDINNDYKCGICNGIINNAHQANCGCNFCFGCISQIIGNGSIICPSCNSENLLEISKNYGLNIGIGKMTVRCTNENCEHECKLIEMNDHLRLCFASVGCPFSDIGCELKDMSSDKLKDHFISNIETHSKILIESIGQLRNEMRELKEDGAKSQSQIKMLIANDLRKDETIELLKNEINTIKKENQELKTLRNNNYKLWNKLDQIDIEINNRCRNDMVKSINENIESIRIDKSELEQQMEIVHRNYKELNENVQQIHQVNVENDKRTKEIERIHKFLQMQNDGHLIWQIGKINEMKQMVSEIFHNFQNPYQMQLCINNATDKLNIQLLIGSGGLDEDLQWPVKGKVSIDILSLIDREKSKSLTKSCTINKPKINSCERSAEFSFLHKDLATLRMLDNNCLIVFFIEFE